MRLLLIESNVSAGRLAGRLRDEGFDVDLAASAASAIKQVATIRYDAIILDTDLPNADGLSLLADLPVKSNGAPVIMVSGCGSLPERTAGFQTGVDDYAAKPIALGEFVTRIRVLLAQWFGGARHSFDLGNLSLDASHPIAFIRNRPLILPAREADILRILIKQRGQVVSKRSINRRLFGLHANSLNAVEVYVHRLRRRLARAGADLKIGTLHRAGYFVAVRPQSGGRKRRPVKSCARHSGAGR
jgi:DNA-binding response OmpR family regulator